MKTFKQFHESWSASVSGNYSNDRRDLFKNPTPKEILEVINQMKYAKKYLKTVRFVLNAETQSLYIIAGDILHFEMFNNTELSHLNYFKGYLKGQYDFLFTGHSSTFNGRKFQTIESDTFDSNDIIKNITQENYYEVLNNMETLKWQDWSFASKWFEDVKQIQEIINRLIKNIEAKYEDLNMEYEEIE